MELKPEFVKSLNKASNKYISDARKREKEFIKKHGDFGRSYHSTPLTADNDFLDFRNYIGQKSWEYLDHQGYVVCYIELSGSHTPLAVTNFLSIYPHKESRLDTIKMKKNLSIFP